MRTVRCSSLPMLFKCPGSQDGEDLLIEAYNAAADLGTATHDGMRSIVTGAAIDLDILALRHGVDRDELGRLIWYGRQVWDELKNSFPEVDTEVEISATVAGVHLVGHVDALSAHDPFTRVARGIDWKTGRKEEADYYAQLAGYATVLLSDYEVDEVIFSVVWLRSQSIETYRFTRKDGEEFSAKLANILASSKRYRHGEHCGHCPRSHNCPALVANAHRDLAIFGGFDVSKGINEASPEMVVDLRRRLKVLETFSASMDQAIRRRVMSEGPLDSGDGYQLAFVEENGKREIDTLKAWSILQEHLTDDELAGCVTVSASRVDDAVAKKAGRGNGKAAKEAVRVELEQAGALTQPKITKLREVRTVAMLEKAAK